MASRNPQTIKVTLFEDTGVNNVYIMRQANSWKRTVSPIVIDLPIDSIFKVGHQECCFKGTSRPRMFNGRITLKKGTILQPRDKKIGWEQLKEDTPAFLDWDAIISIPKGTSVFMDGKFQTLEKDLTCTC